MQNISPQLSSDINRPKHISEGVTVFSKSYKYKGIGRRTPAYKKMTDLRAVTGKIPFDLKADKASVIPRSFKVIGNPLFDKMYIDDKTMYEKNSVSMNVM